MRRVGIVLAFVAVMLAACSPELPVGGGGAQACTEIGCANGVSVAMQGIGLDPGRGRVVARVCFDGACERVRYIQQRNGGARWNNDRVDMFVTPEAVEVTLRLPEDGDFDTTTKHAVKGEVRVPGQPKVTVERRVPLQRSQPNGPDCPPVCWQARIEHAA